MKKTAISVTLASTSAKSSKSDRKKSPRPSPDSYVSDSEVTSEPAALAATKKNVRRKMSMRREVAKASHATSAVRSKSRNGPERAPEEAAAVAKTPMRKWDSLERLMEQVRQLDDIDSRSTTLQGLVRKAVKEKHGEEQPQMVVVVTEPQPKPKADNNLADICNIFGGPSGGATRRTFRDVALMEMKRGESEVDKMIKQSQGMLTAFGRRVFDRSEIVDDDLKDDPEEEEDSALKERVKNAKSRYFEMYNPKETEPEKAKDKETVDTDPQSYGLWDSISNVKIVPTLIRVKKEWQPPDWEKTLERMREEGLDAASLDNALRDLNRESGETGKRTKTGKYLMQEDLSWCRKHARFKEKDLLKWFRRFRSEAPNGSMNKNAFNRLFKFAFPLSNPSVVADIVFQIFDAAESEELDFKEFIMAMDVITCRDTCSKCRWAFLLLDQTRRNGVEFHEAVTILQLLDQVEENGFMDEPTEDQYDDLMYRRKHDVPKLVDDRVRDIWERSQIRDGLLSLEELEKIPERVLFARE